MNCNVTISQFIEYCDKQNHIQSSRFYIQIIHETNRLSAHE